MQYLWLRYMGAWVTFNEFENLCENFLQVVAKEQISISVNTQDGFFF